MAVLISFERIEAVPLSKTPAKILVRWKMNASAEPDLLSDYEFMVYRAEAQNSDPGFQHVDMMRKSHKIPPFTYTDAKNLIPVSQWIDGLNEPWYLDYSPELANLNKVMYYRVRCRKKSTQEAIDSDFFSIDRDLDMVGLYVVEEHNFLLEDTVGVPCLVYNRRREGAYCNNCFDRTQKKRTKSFCLECYNTNWQGGFYMPIDTYIDFSPNPKQAKIAEWGETQPNESNVLASNFPQIGPGDVIFEIPNHRLWRVTTVTETEKRRVPMLQFGRVVEINPKDSEYHLPKDERFILKKVDEVETLKEKREF